MSARYCSQNKTFCTSHFKENLHQPLLRKLAQPLLRKPAPTFVEKTCTSENQFWEEWGSYSEHKLLQCQDKSMRKYQLRFQQHLELPEV